MKTVYKYELSSPLGIITKVSLPKGSTVLSAGIQANDFFIWALVDTEQPTEDRKFIVYGTGWEIDEGIKDRFHIGGNLAFFDLCPIDTVFQGPYVWHIFEVA